MAVTQILKKGFRDRMGEGYRLKTSMTIHSISSCCWFLIFICGSLLSPLNGLETQKKPSSVSPPGSPSDRLVRAVFLLWVWMSEGPLPLIWNQVMN